MAYTIYSIGDSEMLYNALQGVAMIFNSSDMGSLIKSGFILGSFLMGARFWATQRLDVGHILAALLVYMVLFWPKVTAHVEDAYTAQMRDVANVPLGVALPMSVISTIGFRLTQTYEQAFSVPEESSMLQNGYIDSLNTLLKLRYVGSGTAASNPAMNGDLSRSINSYIDTCVRFDLELPYGPHEVTPQGLLKSSDTWAAMKTTFINRDIIVVLPAFPNGKQLSCMDAYIAIDDYLRSQNFSDTWDTYLKGLLGMKDQQATAANKIDNAITALGLVGVGAQNYMLNALMASYLREGPAAVIQRPAMEKMQVQWAAEGGIFRQVARPMMAFIETFTVATAPIAAFLLTIGPIGFTLAARYLQLVAWISLWGPVMAVCNMYITIVSSRALEALANQANANGADITSIAMHDEVFKTLETWVSAGGMLAASVPALSLMLVYGGSMVATSLAGRMTAGVSSSVEPKNLSPEPMSVSSPMAVNGRYQFSPEAGGASRLGVQQPTYSIGSSAEKAFSSASTALSSASAQVSQTQGQMLQTAVRSGHTTRDASSISDALAHSNSSADRYAANVGRQIGDSVGATDVEKRAISTALATNVGASLGVKGTLWGLLTPAEVHAGVEANLASSGVTDAARRHDLATQATQAWMSEHANSDEFRKAKEYSTQHADESVFASESMKSQSEQYQSQLGRVKSASEQYSEMASLKDTASHLQSVDYNNLAERLVKSGKYVDLANHDRDIGIYGNEAAKKEWNERLERAGQQIDRSGAMPSGEERVALRRFLALDSQDPKASAKLALDAVFPATGHRVKSDVEADSHKGLKQSPDGIFSGDAAAAAKQRAEGQGQSNPLASSSLPASSGSAPDIKPAVASHRSASAQASSQNPEVRELQSWMRERKEERGQGGSPGQASTPKSHVEMDSQAFIRARISGGMPQAPAPANVEQFDKTRQQIEDKNLGQSARDHVKNAGGDVIQGVGKAWKKDAIDPASNTVVSGYQHVRNILTHENKTKQEEEVKLEIDIEKKK